MPQDSLKSFVYRSFVTCDDPHGVVECKTTRKSKTEFEKMEGKVGNVKSSKNLVTNRLQNQEREEIFSKKSIDELNKPANVQLKEVSRGAEKLSKVVDSLSKGSFDGQSEDIAKDLLKGALNLQESLQMLGKLQEASKYMENLKKRQKEMSGNHDRKIQRSYSERFGDRTQVMEFQKPRLSADGTSRDCYDELREVIRESFARNNLLPKKVSEEKVHFDRKLDLSPDKASASSSQSSMFNSYELASSNSSSSNLQRKKPRDSNLIAKLMGLEEIPSKPVKATLHDHFMKGNLQRPIFDIDFFNAKKPSFIFQKAKPEQRTLGEIIEIMQFKGLIRNNSFKGSKPKMFSSNFSESSDFVDDSPPIVLMKPPLISSLEKELPDTDKCACGRKDSTTTEMIKQWKVKEGAPPKKIDPQKRGLNSFDIPRRLRVEKNEVKKISPEKAVKNLVRPSFKESKVQEFPSCTRTRASKPVSFKLQKKDAIEKRVDKIQRKSAEKDQAAEAKSRKSNTSKPNNVGKIDSTKATNSIGSKVSKKEVAKTNCTVSDPISKNRTKMVVHNSVNKKKKIKNDELAKKKSSVVVEKIAHKNGDIETDLKFENKDDMVETRITPSEQLFIEEVREASDHCTQDNSCIPCESTAQIIRDNYDVLSEKTNNSGGDHDLVENESSKTRTRIRDILLSSATFMNRAEELFDTICDRPMVLFEETSVHDNGDCDAKLILDYANELLECRFQQWSKFPISFDLLVATIGNGIENLRMYTKLGDETMSSNYLYAVLKKDLWDKGVVTRTWDLGWKNGFTLHEVEQVVVDLEEFLLSKIVEDLLLDFSM